MTTTFIEAWLLWPGNLILLLLMLGLIARKRRARAQREGAERGYRRTTVPAWPLIACALILYAASTGLADRLLMGRMERRVEPAPIEDLQDAEAVVVLGGGVVEEAPSEALILAIDEADGDGAALTTEAESRLIYGLRIAERLGLPIVVSGARTPAVDSSIAEAVVAAALLVDLGYPADRILIEDESRTTAENAANVRDRFAFTRVVLVTSAYHMPRALGAFEEAGIVTLPAPAAFRTDRRRIRAIDFLPQPEALRNSATYLREAVGGLYYALRYGSGSPASSEATVDGET